MSFSFEPTVLTLEQSVYSRWLLLFPSLLFVSISGLRLNCGLRNCTPFNGCSSCCQWFSDLFIAPYRLLLLLLNRAWVHVQSRQAATHKLSLTWRRSQAKKKKCVCVCASPWCWWLHRAKRYFSRRWEVLTWRLYTEVVLNVVTFTSSEHTNHRLLPLGSFSSSFFGIFLLFFILSSSTSRLCCCFCVCCVCFLIFDVHFDWPAVLMANFFQQTLSIDVHLSLGQTVSVCVFEVSSFLFVFFVTPNLSNCLCYCRRLLPSSLLQKAVDWL